MVHSNLIILFLKLTGVVSNFSVSNLSISDFQLAESTFLANIDVSMPVAPFKLDVVA